MRIVNNIEDFNRKQIYYIINRFESDTRIVENVLLKIDYYYYYITAISAKEFSIRVKTRLYTRQSRRFVFGGDDSEGPALK